MWCTLGAAALEPAHVEGALLEVELIPAHGDELADAQAVAVGHEDHGGVAVAALLALRGDLHQQVDLLGGEVLARAQGGVGHAARGCCPIYDGRCPPFASPVSPCFS